MAYPGDFVRINIIGDAYGETEIWNTGFNIIQSPTPDITLDTLEGYAEGIADLWETAFGVSGTGQFSVSHRTTMIKASLIGTDGRVKDDLVAEFFYDQPLVGTGVAVNPAQIATVVSLRSDIRKGAAALGRMYLPAISSTVASDTGLVSAAQVNGLVERMRVFFRGVNIIAVGQGGVGLTSPVGQGRQSLVTRIGVDRIPDTQRRRANSLIGSLSFVDLYEEED